MTTLGPDAKQVEYRLVESAGCQVEIADPQADYRLGEAQATLEWIGEGLEDVGIEPWTALDGDADKIRARALMDGRDPRTGEVLVELKKAVDPRGKLPAEPLVEAVRQAAAVAGTEPGEAFTDPLRAREWRRLERGVAKSQDRYKVNVVLLSRVARAAGLDVDAVYGAETIAEARKYASKRVEVGNRGYDLTLDLPKSYSVLQALAPEDLSVQLDAIFRASVRETVGAVETWAAWGQRGHHGGGRTANRIASGGLLGWSMTHYTARPVGAAAPDPHLHVHLAVANMIKGTDGKWSAFGGGGRDLHRFFVTANEFLKARIRERTSTELGIKWVQDPRTNAWEIAAVPRELRDLFSKRHAQLVPVQRAAVDAGKAVTPGRRDLIGARTARAKDPETTLGDLRTAWRREAKKAGFDIDRIAAAAVRPTLPALKSLRAAFPTPAIGHDVEAIAARVWNVETGLTAHRKIATHADVLAAVAGNAEGITDLPALESLTKRVLAVPGYAHRMDSDLPGTLTHPGRYTSVDIIEAETAILTAARTRMAGQYATVDAGIVAAAIATFEAGAGFELSPEQRAVVERLATAGHGVDAVIGVAGSGKTTLMQALYSAHSAAGHTVAGASTAAIAAQHLQAETGIESRTIAYWLRRNETGPGLAGLDVLVVDESAMVDDRQAARLVEAAGQSGTQIIGIGDPQQLRSPGVGSTFGDVHQLVDGLTLTDNRRQRDETEIKALQAWRDDDRRAIFDRLAERDAVHAEARLDDVWSAMIGSWWARVGGVDDVHDRIKAHLMIAATNDDVDILNQAAQAIRLDAGELDPEAGRDYRVEGGKIVRLHVGDVVAARANDYDAGLLNGTRGVVTAISGDGTVHVDVREAGPDGPVLVPKVVAERYVRMGDLTHGYALTGHRAQGQDADTVHVSLTGMDAHAAYAALTRHRNRVDAWLAADVLEDDAARARLGEPGSDTERIERAVDAYLTHLDRPEPDPLVISGLAEHEHLLDHRDRPEPAPPEARPRPYADLDARELLTAYMRAHQAVERAEQRAETAGRAEAAYTRDQAVYAAELADAEDGRGKAALGLEQRRAALARAETLIGTVQEHRDRYNQLGEVEREGYQTGSAAKARAAQNPVKLLMQGTSRAEQRQAAEAAYDRVREARAAQQDVNTQMHEAESALRQAIKDVGLQDGKWLRPVEVAPALADLETNWETRRSDAIAVDRAAVREPAPPRTTLADARTMLDRAQTQRQGLSDELTERNATPAGKLEITAASTALQAEAAQAARERQAEQQRIAEQEAQLRPPGYGHHPRPDNGPSMGFGR